MMTLQLVAEEAKVIATEKIRGAPHVMLPAGGPVDPLLPLTCILAAEECRDAPLTDPDTYEMRGGGSDTSTSEDPINPDWLVKVMELIPRGADSRTLLNHRLLTRELEGPAPVRGATDRAAGAGSTDRKPTDEQAQARSMPRTGDDHSATPSGAGEHARTSPRRSARIAEQSRRDGSSNE